MTDDHYLFKEIAEAVAKDPSIVPDIHRAIGDGFAAFQAAEKLKRDQVARSGIHSLMMIGDFEGKGLPFLVNPAYHQFPKGPTNSSPTEKRFWGHFINAVAQAIDDDPDGLPGWLRGQMGDDFMIWWNKYVVPEVIRSTSGRIGNETGDANNA